MIASQRPQPYQSLASVRVYVCAFVFVCVLCCVVES